MTSIADQSSLCRDCPFPFKNSEPLINFSGGVDTPFPLSILDGGDNVFPLSAPFSIQDAMLEVADRIKSLDWLASPDINGSVLLIVTGQFASIGWNSAVLLERKYVTFPSDGIIDFDLAAIRPKNTNRGLSFLRAQSEIRRDGGIKGVRVHGKSNEIEAMLPV